MINYSNGHHFLPNAPSITTLASTSTSEYDFVCDNEEDDISNCECSALLNKRVSGRCLFSETRSHD